MDWNFDNSYLTLPEAFYRSVSGQTAIQTETILFNTALADELSLPQNIDSSILSGSKMPEGAASIALAYAGHQFGHFTMLGDGRALLMGEHITPENDRYDIHLKGSGRTPYSRGGDGQAPLGPMLREYIVSEYMHYIHIPTTRSLAVTLTGNDVLRETSLPGAVLTRVAASHIRVGTFEYAARIDFEHLKALTDYTISRHYPECFDEDHPYASFLETVIERQAELIAKWQCAGFIHGVMNTDNMSIAGETIDYGPCAFMDEYVPNICYSSIDQMGRYRFDQQPGIAQWNLARFAETLLPLLDDNIEEAKNIARQTLQDFPDIYLQYWLQYIGEKIGLSRFSDNDTPLLMELLEIMEEESLDYINTFRLLTQQSYPSQSTRFLNWWTKWQTRLKEESDPYSLMKRVNPTVIPRNHLVNQAIEEVYNGNMDALHSLLEVLRHPYADNHEDKYLSLPKENEKVIQTYCGT